MTIISAIIALGASALLLISGYLFGVRRGNKVREALRRENSDFAHELAQQRATLAHQAEAQDATLRATIEQALKPFLLKEQLSQGLSQASIGEHRDLTPLLDQIAEKGEFSTVLLSNEQGLPLAANKAAPDVERLLATASLMLLVSDRISGHQAPAPRAIMVYDETDATTLCRIFYIKGQRLSLTAVASGARLTPTVLDPALDKVGALLTRAS